MGLKIAITLGPFTVCFNGTIFGGVLPHDEESVMAAENREGAPIRCTEKFVLTI